MPLPLRVALTLLMLPLAIGTSAAQNAPPNPSTPPTGTTTPAPPDTTKTPGQPSDTGKPAVPSPGERNTTPAPADNPAALNAQGSGTFGPFGSIVANNGVHITYNGVTITADSAVGNVNREIVFSGHARITQGGSVTDADAIHLFPRENRYRLDNPRAVLTPDLLQNRVEVPVYVNGGELFGVRTGYSLADHIIVTTCVEPFHHYELRIKDATLYPHQRIVMHNVSVFLFGAKVITLPYVIVPLDEHRRPRTDYLPEFGENYYEGYFARFPYVFAEGGDAATYLRADTTQKKGLGYRVEQEYLAGKQTSFFNTGGAGYAGALGTSSDQGAINTAYGYGSLGPRLARLGTGLGPQSGGLFTMQGYLNSGFNQDFNASFRHQQSIGSNNVFGISTQLQKQSFYLSENSTNQATQFTFNHDDTTHGVASDIAINYTTNSSPGFDNSQLTGTYHQAFNFASLGTTRNSLLFDFNLSRSLSTSTTTGTDASTSTSSTQRSAFLTSSVNYNHTAREYTLTFDANKNTTIGSQTSGSNFGTLEKLPELQFSADTINFKGGWLRNLPANFLFGIGRYSEPSTSTDTERAVLALNLEQFSVLRGRTEVATAGGFEQRLYGDGAAQYTITNNSRLRQHLGGRSGIDLDYQYAQPEGGTPFNFDPFTRAHTLTGEAGYLDDTHFQFTARTGYNLQGQTGGSPWQSVSTRLMWRPKPFFRFDQISSFDPNTNRFVAFQQQLQLRGHDDIFFDLVSSIDPQAPGIRRKFTNINTQFGFPVGRTWRVTGLFRFSGTSGLIESRNLQISHRWDCLEASLTYTENPNSFTNDRQIYFALRVIGLPFYRAFNRGTAGQGITTGIGNVY